MNNTHRQTLELAGRIPGSSRRPKQKKRANRRGISVLTSWNRFVPESFRSIRALITFKPVEPEMLPVWKAPWCLSGLA